MRALRRLPVLCLMGVFLAAMLPLSPEAEARRRRRRRSARRHKAPRPRPVKPAPAEPRLRLLAGVEAVHLLAGDQLHPPQQRTRGSLAITAQGPLVVTGNNLYLPLRKQVLLTRLQPGMSDGLLLPHGLFAIAEKSLGMVLRNAFVSKVSLPTAGMRLTAGGHKGELLIYGATADGKGGSVYRYRPGGHVTRLIAASSPVRAAVAHGKHLFIATGRDVYAYQHGVGLLRLYRTPKGTTVDSVAFDPKTSLLYFSTGRAVWALLGPFVACVADGLAGELTWNRGSLYVLDRQADRLWALRNTSLRVLSLLPRRPAKSPTAKP